MENAIVQKTPYLPSEGEFQSLQFMARNAASSGLYGNVGSEQKILMVLLYASELGISPMQALNGGIWNIQGKIEISARLMNSMIRRAGHSINILKCDEKICVIEGRRCDNGDSFSAQFTIEDAVKAGISTRQNWKAYPEDMLYSRALSRLGRRLFPDIIGMAYVEGEIKDAKCEIISSIIEEDPEEEENRLNEFVQVFEEENHQMMKSYIHKYCAHWQKKITQALHDYSDQEKFMNDFLKWKKKEETKSVQ